LEAIRAGKLPDAPAASGITASIKNRITESLTGKQRLLRAARIIAEGVKWV
jgi:hypothetical protein